MNRTHPPRLNLTRRLPIRDSLLVSAADKVIRSCITVESDRRYGNTDTKIITPA